MAFGCAWLLMQRVELLVGPGVHGDLVLCWGDLPLSCLYHVMGRSFGYAGVRPCKGEDATCHVMWMWSMCIMMVYISFCFRVLHVLVPYVCSSIPETIFKKRRAAAATKEVQAQRKQVRADRLKAKRAEIFKRAKAYAKEYRAEEKSLVQFRRQARKSGTFFVEAEPKLAFVVRIRGINDVDPRTRKILCLLRLNQINKGVFVKLTSATRKMLELVAPYITWGYPTQQTVSKLIYKRGYGKVAGNRIPLSDNKVIEGALGKFNIVCVEDLIHEIVTVGPAFQKANNFLWAFKLNTPKGGMSLKRKHFVEGGQCGNREGLINAFVGKMV